MNCNGTRGWVDVCTYAVGYRGYGYFDLGLIGANEMRKIIVDGVEFVESVATGNRAVIVVDRGWIFAGDVTRENGRIKLTRAVHVFRWESIGFDGMIANPMSSKVTLKKIENVVDIPEGSEIFCVPVCNDWGIS